MNSEKPKEPPSNIVGLLVIGPVTLGPGTHVVVRGTHNVTGARFLAPVEQPPVAERTPRDNDD